MVWIVYGFQLIKVCNEHCKFKLVFEKMEQS